MIKTSNLCKTSGDRAVVADVTLTIAPGECYGLLGPLDSGNATVVRMLATLTEITRGGAEVAGCDLKSQAEQARQEIGYLPEVPGAYDDMRVAEYLKFFTQACHVGEAGHRRVDRLLALADLAGMLNLYYEALDRENKKRLGLVKAALHDPPVLLLEQPAGGLDLAARRRVLDLVRRIQQLGPEPKTVLLSTNILSDAAAICDRVGIMNRGRLVLEGTTAEILAQLAAERYFELEVADDAPDVVKLLQAQPAIGRADAHGNYVIFNLTDAAGDPLAMLELVRGAGQRVLGYREHEIDFEQVALQTK